MVEFFPEKVYHCSCVSLDVKLCLVNGNYSLTDICNEINQTRGEKLYCSRCGGNNEYVIFSCLNHMAMVIFHQEINNDYIDLTIQSKDQCLRCIRKYLKIAYKCCYEYTDFDLPMSIKKNKKTLCLCLSKCC